MVAHQYGRIDHGLVWKSITEEIPELKAECIRMLSELSS